ncbi:hypothetical protein VNO80_30476 [Phaseolus coccineus]|uniref:Uncharacterized protein n=1 Tax=Phaseolus coccineus TaxID=3886 RepID=A0AAN9LGC9_PHACN
MCLLSNHNVIPVELSSFILLSVTGDVNLTLENNLLRRRPQPQSRGHHEAATTPPTHALRLPPLTTATSSGCHNYHREKSSVFALSVFILSANVSASRAFFFFFVWIRVFDMANTEEAEPSNQLATPNSFIDERSKVLMQKYLKILRKFITSKDRVYMIYGHLSGEERQVLEGLCRHMELGLRSHGIEGEWKIIVFKVNSRASKKSVLSGKRKSTEKPESCGENAEICELNKIWISQTLKKFSASNDEGLTTNISLFGVCCCNCYTFHKILTLSTMYNFEPDLSFEKCVAVHQLSQEMGFQVENSGSGMRQKAFVNKIEKNIHTTPKLENLPSFTFSGQSKRVLANLFKQYPPDDEELCGVRIESSGDTTDRTKVKEDDVFSRPCMSKVEITKRLEILSNGMRDSFKLKLINEKRSKLPITSFKDIITSTVESHQVNLMSLSYVVRLVVERLLRYLLRPYYALYIVHLHL